jgi:hypothetical protein
VTFLDESPTVATEEPAHEFQHPGRVGGPADAGPSALRRRLRRAHGEGMDNSPSMVTGSDTIEQQRMVISVAELPVEECWRRLAEVPTGRRT